MKKETISKKISVNLVFSGIMGLLILTTFMQTLELNQIKIYAEEFLQGKNAQAASIAPTTVAQPAPVRSTNNGLPSQVGGC